MLDVRKLTTKRGPESVVEVIGTCGQSSTSDSSDKQSGKYYKITSKLYCGTDSDISIECFVCLFYLVLYVVKLGTLVHTLLQHRLSQSDLNKNSRITGFINLYTHSPQFR